MIASWLLFLTQILANPLELKVTLGDKALDQQKIQVVGFKSGRPEFDKTLITNARGTASLQVPKDPNLHLMAHVRYQNISYTSTILNAADLPKTEVLIRVYPAVESHSGLKIEDLRFYFSETDQGLKVEQEIVVMNPSQNVVSGKLSPDQPDLAPETFRFQLPPSAFDLKFNAGFSQETTRFENNDILLARPLMPGRTHLSIEYVLEKVRTGQQLKQAFSLPIETVSVGSNRKGLKIGPNFVAVNNAKPMGNDDIYLFTRKMPSGSKEVAIEIRGLAFNLRLAEVLAPLAFILFLLVAWLLQRQSRTIPPAPSKDRLQEALAEWTKIKMLQSNRLISDQEVYDRKLKCLEKLIPEMNNQGRRAPIS